MTLSTQLPKTNYENFEFKLGLENVIGALNIIQQMKRNDMQVKQ